MPVPLVVIKPPVPPKSMMTDITAKLESRQLAVLQGRVRLIDADLFDAPCVAREIVDISASLGNQTRPCSNLALCTYSRTCLSPSGLMR